MSCASSNCDCCPKWSDCYPKLDAALDKFDHDRKTKKERELEDRG